MQLRTSQALTIPVDMTIDGCLLPRSSDPGSCPSTLQLVQMHAPKQEHTRPIT